MIKVSVLVTTYNLEEYIEHTLEQIVKQKVNFKYEILIGDDGSDDSTLEIVQKFKEKTDIPITIYVMERKVDRQYNPIVRASRNRINLIKHAHGKYINFLDGDDFYINENMLQILSDKLDQHPDCSMCGGDLILYKEGIAGKRVIGANIKEGYISKERYWANYWIHAECFLFRNYYFKELKIDMNQDMFDDNLITYYFMNKGKIYYVDSLMVAYRQNLTAWKKKSKLEKSTLNALDIFEENNINPRMFLINLFRHSCDLKEIIENKEKYKNKMQYLGYWQKYKNKIPFIQDLINGSSKTCLKWKLTQIIVRILSYLKAYKQGKGN